MVGRHHLSDISSKASIEFLSSCQDCLHGTQCPVQAKHVTDHLTLSWFMLRGVCV